MKVRNGFVSNSSSSSFLIKRPMTTSQVALMMMFKLKKEALDDSVSYQEWKINRLELYDLAINWLKDNIDFDDPILIPWTTNYETFIWREVDRDIYVSSCNNQDWNMLAPEYEICEDNEKFFAYAHDDTCRKFKNLSNFNCISRADFYQEQLEEYRSSLANMRPLLRVK